MSTEAGVLDRNVGVRPAPKTAVHDMTIEVTSDLDAAARSYGELEAGGVMSAFQTRLWIECWATQLARPRSAEVLFCSVRTAGGRPVMLLPLCRRVDGRLRVIEGADLGVSDYVAPVMAPAFKPTQAEWAALWPRIVAALPAHDLLRLTKIPLMIRGGGAQSAGVDSGLPHARTAGAWCRRVGAMGGVDEAHIQRQPA